MFSLKTILPILLLAAAPAMAQDDPQWPSLSYLRSDYRESVIVAHVRVTQAEVVQRIPGYDDWRIVCDVVEPFKGKFQKGQTLTYWVYAVIENSTLPYNDDRVIKLRKIKRTAQKKPASKHVSGAV